MSEKFNLEEYQRLVATIPEEEKKYLTRQGSRQKGKWERNQAITLILVLKGIVSGRTGPYLDDILNIRYKDLAVADMAGVKRLAAGLHNRIDWYAADNHLELDLRTQRHIHCNAAVELGSALLNTAAEYVGDGDAGDTGYQESFRLCI